MSALSADREVKRKDGEYQLYELYQAVTIYKGAMVCVRESDGYLVPLSDSAGLAFVGTALEAVDNSAGVSGELEVRVEKKGNFQYVKASAVQADVGDLAYGLDDQTVATTSTNSIEVGYIQAIIDSSTVYVRVDRAVQ